MVMGDVATGTDVLVIGGGPGGYVAAIRAAQRDLDVTLVERDAYGGTCLNHGCIPSKAFITAADVAHEAGNAEAMGIHADPAVDAGGLADWRDGVVDRMSGSVEKLCKANGVDLLAGTARFEDDHVARVAHENEGGRTGTETGTVEFEHAVVATGSRPVSLPGFGFDAEPVWDSAAALSVRELPDRLVVVGAGYIGMELSAAFAKLGVDVTVLEALDDVLPGYEDDVARTVRRRASDLGVEFRFGRAATGWRENADGGIVVRATDGDGEETSHPADRVLVAVGREPVTDTVGLSALGLEPNDDGAIETDERTRTAREHVHAVGDVAGDPMLAHVASREGVVAAETIAGEPATVDTRAIPGAVFTDPEVGTVGLTEPEAAEAGHEPVVGQMPFRASGRALTAGPDHTEGFVRIVADDATGTVLGGQIVGPEASELIAEVALAVEMGATLEDLGATIHTHPTLAEAVMEAAENARDRAIHTLNR